MLRTAASHESFELPVYPVDARYNLRVGYANFYDIDSTIRADSSAGVIGAVLSFERDLNVERSVGVWRLKAGYRVNKRHGINLNYYRLKRNATVILDREINFRDQTFNVDRLIMTEFKNTVIELDYKYTLLANSRVAFNVGLGLRTDGLEVQLQSLVNPGDIDNDNESEVAEGRLYLPLYVMTGRLNFTPKFSVSTKVKQLLLEIDPVEGVFNNLELFFDYQFTKKCSIGFSFSQANTNLEAIDDDLRISYKNTADSIFSYISFDF